MTTINAFEGHPSAFKEAKTVHGFVTILRTGRSKATGAVRKKDFHEAVIRTKGLLIQTNQHQNDPSRKMRDLVLRHAFIMMQERP